MNHAISFHKTFLRSLLPGLLLAGGNTSPGGWRPAT